MPDTETLTFVERRDEGAGVYTYSFTPANPISFVAGQYAHLLVPQVPEGAKSVREISFASSPGNEVLEFGIDSRSGSEWQKALLDLVAGDTIKLFKIKGNMTWPEPSSEIVMIAGGVGVTPFRSMLLDIAHEGRTVRATLLHVSSTALLYKAELELLVANYVSIQRAELEDALTHVATEQPEAHYYVAGSSLFVQYVAESLRQKAITTLESDVFKGLHDDL